MENVLKLWETRGFPIEVKIKIFKTLAITPLFNNCCTSFYYRAAECNKKALFGKEKT